MILFTRLFIGVTKIREQEYGQDAKLCDRVVGYDANALYLWSMSQQMPTGRVIVREKRNNYVPAMYQKFWMSAHTW